MSYRVLLALLPFLLATGCGAPLDRYDGDIMARKAVDGDKLTIDKGYTLIAVPSDWSVFRLAEGSRTVAGSMSPTLFCDYAASEDLIVGTHHERGQMPRCKRRQGSMVDLDHPDWMVVAAKPDDLRVRLADGREFDLLWAKHVGRQPSGRRWIATLQKRGGRWSYADGDSLELPYTYGAVNVLDDDPATVAALKQGIPALSDWSFVPARRVRLSCETIRTGLSLARNHIRCHPAP